MALAVDATSNTASTTSPLTVSHTCTGSNRLLTVQVMVCGTQTIDSVTYGGTPMSLAVGFQDSNGNRYGIYYLVAPATGPNNIVVTLSANQDCVVGGISFTGADQTSPIGAATTQESASGSSILKALTTLFANSIIETAGIWLNNWAAGQTLSATGSNQTAQWKAERGVSSPLGGFGASTQTTNSPGSYTNSWSRSAGASIPAMVLVEIKEVQPVIPPASVPSIPDYQMKIKDNVIAY